MMFSLWVCWHCKGAALCLDADEMGDNRDPETGQCVVSKEGTASRFKRRAHGQRAPPSGRTGHARPRCV